MPVQKLRLVIGYLDEGLYAVFISLLRQLLG